MPPPLDPELVEPLELQLRQEGLLRPHLDETGPAGWGWGGGAGENGVRAGSRQQLRTGEGQAQIFDICAFETKPTASKTISNESMIPVRIAPASFALPNSAGSALAQQDEVGRGIVKKGLVVSASSPFAGGTASILVLLRKSCASQLSANTVNGRERDNYLILLSSASFGAPKPAPLGEALSAYT